jgi:hypothetical protein
MKTVLLAILFLFSFSIHGQVGTSARTLTKRIDPLIPPRPPRSVPQGIQPNTGVPVTNAPLTAAELEKKKAQRAAEDKKKLAWQKERAEKGSDSSQYALGMRYLNGDGVEKNTETGMKWLKESARNGNDAAKKKLQELEASKPILDLKKRETVSKKD